MMSKGSTPTPRSGPAWPKTPKSSKSQGAECAKRPATGSGKRGGYSGGGK